MVLLCLDSVLTSPPAPFEHLLLMFVHGKQKTMNKVGVKCCEADGRPWHFIKEELLLLRQRWHIILVGLAFQYVHGIFTQLAYHMHQPQSQPLHDVGFELIPELPADKRWISEAIFTTLLLSFIAWTFTPLLMRRNFSTVVLWTRLLTVLVVCQSLRILSFSATQLPGPALHCRSDQLTATIAPPKAWWQYLVVNVGRQAAHSCGDLIFSSHMTFILTGILAYTQYGSKRCLKVAAWLAGAVLAVLIISARKHYTVDVVIAWYTVPMVYTLLHILWRQLNMGSNAAGALCGSCSSNSSSSYIAVSSKDVDSVALQGLKKGRNSCDTAAAAAAAANEGCTACQIVLPVSSSSVRYSRCGGVDKDMTPSRGAVSVSPVRSRSPRSRSVWLFGSGTWGQQQQQLAKADSGVAPDIEAQDLLDGRQLSGVELQLRLDR